VATLILGLAGGAVGSAIGGSVLGVSAVQIGQAVGALAGRAVDTMLLSGGDGQVTEGPRLDNLQVTLAQEGAPLPEVWGRTAVPGTMIWATEIRETRVEEDITVGSGKASTTTTEVTYEYDISIAVSLSEGEIAHVGRIWADGDLFDPTAMIDDGRLRVYKGSEVQPIDPTIEAVEDGAPAFLGTAYLVLEALALADYGNRVPQLRVELWGRSGTLEADLLRGVNIIPGTTGWGYDPGVVTQVSRDSQGNVIEEQPENNHRHARASDWRLSMDLAQGVMPALGTASLVVSWFGTDLRAGECRVEPRVERKDKETSPAWAAAGLTRASATVVSQADGRPAFGAAPADAAVIAALEDLATRGLRRVLYPFLMMDITEAQALPDPSGSGTQGAYPWRGRIAPEAGQDVAAEIAAFVGTAQVSDFAVVDGAVQYSGPEEWRWRRFILHLAHLAKAAGGVEAFLVGTELRGLTMARAPDGSYPFVDALRTLAADVKAVLPGAEVSYAADWSEYHSHREGGDVRFHLDPFWADANVGFVGIDNYLPLSDWRPGEDHLDHDDAAGVTSVYDLGYLKGNVEGGEFWDWYYASDADRAAQVRTPIEDATYGKPWVFRQKAIRDWHGNAHYDRPGGVEPNNLLEWSEDLTASVWMVAGGGSPVKSTSGSDNTVKWSSGGGNLFQSNNNFPLSPGTTYTFSIMVKVVTLGGSSASDFLLSIREHIPTVVVKDNTNITLTDDGNWHEYSVTGTTAGTITGAGFYVHLRHSGTGSPEIAVLSAGNGAQLTASAGVLPYTKTEGSRAVPAATAWVPGSKPVWFTELGCPAVDFGANQPAVFYSPKSSESDLPHFAAGVRDDFMQRQYLRAQIEWWRDNAPGIVAIDDVQVWAWDARPWPEFPTQDDLWADGPDWRLGHWLNGRAGSAPVAAIVEARLLRAGLPADRLAVSRAFGQVAGYEVTAPIDFRQVAAPLQQALALTIWEEGGIVHAGTRGAAPRLGVLANTRLVAAREGPRVTVTRRAAEDVPSVARLTFRDAARDYEPATAVARREAAPELTPAEARVPLTFDFDTGHQAAQLLLASARAGREVARLAAPPSAVDLRPAAILPVETHAGLPVRELFVTRLERGAALDVEAETIDRAAFALARGVFREPRALPVIGSSTVTLSVMDLPLVSTDIEDWDAWLVAHADPWPGVVVVDRAAAQDGSFAAARNLVVRGALGETLTDLAPGRAWRWSGGTLDLRLFAGQLVSRTEEDVLAGANALALRHAAGWEIVQFRDAELIGAGTYRLSRLLRGVRGTEGVPDAAPLGAGARAVLLDGAAVPAGLATADLGAARWYRHGPPTVPEAERAVISETVAGVGRRPYAPHFVRVAASGGDRVISWLRRSRLLAPTLPPDGAPMPIGESAESYRVEIGPAGAPWRVATVASPSFNYTASMQSDDGAVPPYDVRLAQIGDAWGAGAETQITVRE